MIDSDFIPTKSLNTAVLFVIFNRLETTKQVFNAIKKAKPPRLYVAADGARSEFPEEKEKVEIVREYIINNIDWQCEVKTLFRGNNLGCKYAVSGAISWFFDNEEMGIILEDDCLPSQSFFWFCEELLIKFKKDSRVGQISGFNHGYKDINLIYDYFFSKYPSIWGWASWRRAWQSYDVEMRDYDEMVLNGFLESTFCNKKEQRYRNKIFNDTRNGKIDTWDYQWSYNLYKSNQLTIIPKKNLILNIGFGNDSTHTKGKDPYSKNNLESYENELIHIKGFIKNIRYDKAILDKIKNIQRIKSFIKRHCCKW